MTSLSLQAAGVVGLLTAVGHLQMGRSALSPKVPKTREAQTALKGWYQGVFMYATFGLNYLRIAAIPILAPLDYAILAGQGAMHLYTLFTMPDLPPRVLSSLLLGLVAAGLITK